MNRVENAVRTGLVGLLAVSLACGGSPGTVSTSQTAAASGTSFVPAQFLAKMYTEALGRRPDVAGWRHYRDFLATNGCTTTRLRGVARDFYTSPEFSRRGYDNPARLLALYRGVLNREPDQRGLEYWVRRLESGESWPQVVNALVDSYEFGGLAREICGGSAGYGFGIEPAPTLPVSGTGFAGGTGEELQAILDATPAGGTVHLAQKAVVRVNAPLVIPAGVSLTTTGAPKPTHYALQGRLVRTRYFAEAAVRLQDGAQLRNVWVDGQLGSINRYVLKAINVQTLGGTGISVAENRLSNSAGWSNVQVLGSKEGRPCAETKVLGNLVTAYSGTHYMLEGQRRYTDGLSIACEDTLVTGNSIIDATDVGIVLFRSRPAVQRSRVVDNFVISTGNSAKGGMTLDSGHSQSVTSDFTGASVSGNHLWTGPNTHFDIGISVGVRPWFGRNFDPGTGATVNDNTSGGMTARVGTGIAVSGMLNATVQGNTLSFKVLSQGVSPCPHVELGIDADGFASGGNIQPGGVSVSFLRPDDDRWGCISPEQP